MPTETDLHQYRRYDLYRMRSSMQAESVDSEPLYEGDSRSGTYANGRRELLERDKKASDFRRCQLSIVQRTDSR